MAKKLVHGSNNCQLITQLYFLISLSVGAQEVELKWNYVPMSSQGQLKTFVRCVLERKEVERVESHCILKDQAFIGVRACRTLYNIFGIYVCVCIFERTHL